MSTLPQMIKAVVKYKFSDTVIVSVRVGVNSTQDEKYPSLANYWKIRLLNKLCLIQKLN